MNVHPMRLSGWGVAALLAFATAWAQPAPGKDARQAFGKASSELRAGQVEDALRDYREAVALSPDYAEAWYELGRLQLDRQQDHDARQSFEAAIRADSKYAAPYLPLASIEYAARRWPQLVDVTERLLQIDSIDYPLAWLLNAAGQYNNHNAEAAEKSVREAERLDPERRLASSWRLLGEILLKRGDTAGAADQFRAYLKAAPGAADAEAVRAKLEKLPAGLAESEAAATFSSDVNLIAVRFQYYPNKSDPPRELRAEDIEIREDGAARPVAFFAPIRRAGNSAPVEISLLFDCSASMDRIQAGNPNIFRENLLDEFPNISLAVYGFSDSLARFTRPTRDPAALKKAIAMVGSIAAGDTPLFGAITDTIHDAGATGSAAIRMLVIVSDGESSTPGDELRAGEAIKAAERSGTVLFPVIPTKGGAFGSMDSQQSVSDFEKLASATGGRVLGGIMGTDVLPAILKAVAREIQDDYIAGYYMTSPGKKTRQIKVVLRPQVRGRIYGGARVLETMPAGR